jgi:hypothetical protein
MATFVRFWKCRPSFCKLRASLALRCVANRAALSTVAPEGLLLMTSQLEANWIFDVRTQV